MKRRDFIVQTLVKIGFRISLKGFDQFCLCLELYVDGEFATVEDIYAEVACTFGCTKSAVEKNLRRLFYSSDAVGAVSRLYGIEYTDCGNKQIIAMVANYIACNRNKYIAVSAG